MFLPLLPRQKKQKLKRLVWGFLMMLRLKLVGGSKGKIKVWKKMFHHFLKINLHLYYILKSKKCFRSRITSQKPFFGLTISKGGFWVAILDYKNYFFVQFLNRFWIFLSIVQCGNKVNVLFHPSEHYHLPATKSAQRAEGRCYFKKKTCQIPSKSIKVQTNHSWPERILRSKSSE